MGWIGLVFLAWASMQAIGFYGACPEYVWGSSVGLGAVLMLGHAWQSVPRKLAGVAALCVLPALFLGHAPTQIGAGLMAVGFFLQFLPARRTLVLRIGGTAVSAGAISMLMAFAMNFYASVTARSPLLPAWCVSVLAKIGGILGLDIAQDAGQLVIFSMRTKHPLAATWNLLIDPASFCFVIGATLLILLSSTKRRGAALVVLALIAAPWLVLRTMLLIVIYSYRVLLTEFDADLDQVSQFWNVWWHLLLLLPLALLAWYFVKLHRTPAIEDEEVGESMLRPRLLSLLGVGVAAILITMGSLWQPSGAQKRGRILIDEFHSKVDARSLLRWPSKDYDTTSTLRAYDRDWYGQAAAYNYTSLYEYLSRIYTMSRNEMPLSDKGLEDIDVLVLKLPSKYFTEEEIAAVQRFVERGGGVFLLGEHTTVFGSGVCLNQIARGFGFEFRYDCLFGIDSVFKQSYSPPLVPHPSIQHMGPLNFAVSCSIDPGTSPGTAVIHGVGLKNLGSDYFASNFYPQPNDAPEMLYGSFVQLWATDHGAGRVLAFTDSTIFANFSIFEPGKKELFLGMMQWLNHKQGLPTYWLMWAGLLLLGVIFWRARSPRVDTSIVVATIVLGWSLGSIMTHSLHASDLPQLEPQRPVVSIAFEQSLSPGIIWTDGGFIPGKANSFGLFERSIQRLTKRHTASDPGLTWTSFRSQDFDVGNSDLVVVINPDQPVDAQYRQRVEDYVKAGGKLLVLDSAGNKTSTANKILEPFGMSLESTIKGKDGAPISLAPLSKLYEIKQARTLKGGTALVTLGGSTVAAHKKHGKGHVIVIGFASRFSDLNMGVSGDTIPDEKLRQVYDFEFALLDAIISSKF